MSRALVWFRNDLRLHDNESVTRAITDNKECYFVYIHSNKPDDTGPVTSLKPYRHRAKFVLECLHDLNKQLTLRGATLLYYEGDACNILRELCQKLSIDSIYTGAEYATYEKDEVQQISKHVHVKCFHTSTLIHPEQLPFTLADLPDVFTAFRNKVEKNFRIANLYQVPDRFSPTSLFIKGLNIPALIEDKSISNFEIQFTGGRAAALKRLHHYFFESKCISRYKETRNGMLGMDYSSKFSPWLAVGCISAREVYAQLLRYESEHGSNESTYWLKFELLWRDYFRFVAMKYGNRLFYASGIKNRQQMKVNNYSLLEKWCTGNTGEPFVDANMRELWHTGFMSNRGRQNVASYLVHDLQLDWRLGAAWFERVLIDYDVYSNYGNWQYIAGVGNDSRTYRKFNIKRQQEMYDADLTYTNYWLNNKYIIPLS